MIERPGFSDVAQHFSLGAFEVNAQKNIIIARGKEHSVEPRLIRVIVRLAKADGDVVDRQTLLQEISDQSIASDESLTQAISTIRQLLDDDPKKPQFIKTIPRKGYLLLVPAMPINENAEAPERASVMDNPISSERRTLLTLNQTHWKMYAALIAIILVLIAIMTWPEETTFIEKGEIEFIEKED